MGRLRLNTLNVITHWREENPKGKKIDCIRDLNYSFNTVNKYWGKCGESLSAKDKVENWCKDNPKGKKAWCVSETNLSFPTVNKYWINNLSN